VRGVSEGIDVKGHRSGVNEGQEIFTNPVEMLAMTLSNYPIPISWVPNLFVPFISSIHKKKPRHVVRETLSSS
jgi:hypothetical protein